MGHSSIVGVARLSKGHPQAGMLRNETRKNWQLPD